MLEEAITNLASSCESGKLDSQLRELLEEFTPEEAHKHSFSLQEHMDIDNTGIAVVR